MGISPTGVFYGEGGTAGDGYLHLPPLEHTLATRSLMDLCLTVERSTGSKVAKKWLDQDVLDVEEMQTASWDAEWTEGEEEAETD